VTELEWLGCADPQEMVRYLYGKASERKLRLFGCACCRCVWHLLAEEVFRNAVEVAERFADGAASKKELAEAKKVSGVAIERLVVRGVTGSPLRALGAAWSTTCTPVEPAATYPICVFRSDDHQKQQVSLLRCIFGNPFRPVTLDPAWLIPTVTTLARIVYDDRAFDQMPDLADALEAAGCTHEEILVHSREPRDHARGCWVVDLLLGKE
jgi:hypothetical protein